MLIIVKLANRTSQQTAFFAMVGIILSHSHPHVAELGAVKEEMDKMKQKMESSQTSVAKVCSLLAVLF